MNPFAVAGLLLGITCLLLAVFVLIYGKLRLHRVWALFNLVVAIWGFGAFYIGISLTPEQAILNWKIAHIGGIFIPVTFFHTICTFCEIEKKRKKYIKFAYLQGIVFLLLNFTGILITDVKFAFDSLYYNQSNGVPYLIFFFIWVSFVAWGHYELISYYRKSTGVKRQQSIYFFVGISVGFLGGTTNFFPMFGIDIYPFGNFTIPLYCLISTYAILRYRLMDINLVFRKSMVYSLSAGILTSLFVVIVISMTKFLSDVAGVKSYTILAIASLIIAILFNPLRNRIQRLVDKRFYKRSYDYYSTIQQVSSTLASIFNRDNISKFIGNIVYEVLGLERVYMLAFVPAEGIFEINHKISKDSGKKFSVLDEGSDKLNIHEGSEAIKFYTKSRDIIIKDELPHLEERVGRDIAEEIKKEMDKFDADVLVPVFVDEKLLFLIVLGEKLSGDMFTNEDINLLSTISEQTAIALKNAEFYGKKVQTERLASIGMMSATFAHEIRNPLTSLKTFAQLMPEKYNDPEFRGAFSKIVEGEIEKIDTLIGDLLDFSSEKKSGRVNDFNIVELVDETVEYIKGKFNPAKKDIVVEKRYGEKEIQMFGDANKLKQAFGIIITNGYQAMNGSGKLTVEITTNGEIVEVAISDTGEGIRHEDISKIFDPFVTTKEMGVGLGLAITKRVIEDHEGKIHVKSSLSEGSTFTISLPVKS